MVDPSALLARVVRTLETSLDGLQRIAEAEGGRNRDAIAMGAYSRAASVAVTLLDVAERTGLAPPGRGAWEWTRDVRSFVTRLLEVAERHGIDVGELIRDLEKVDGVATALATTPDWDATP